MNKNVNRNLNKLFSLEGKTIVMTGAAGAIGSVLSKGMASVGGKMVLCDVNRSGLDPLAEEIRQEGGEAIVFPLNLLHTEEIQPCVDSIVQECGKIDVLVNMAGINKRHPILDNDPELFDQIMGVNLKGAYFLSQAVAKNMKENHNGSIINVASYNSVMMLGGNSIYGASKSGVAAMTRSQAIEWAQYGIRSNALSPGHISTQLTAPLWDNPVLAKYLLDRIAMARPGKPEDLLGMAILLASDASAYMSGMLYHVDGGCLAGGQPWEIG
ncbi:MAG: SDR family oxidoreductase [Eubacteriales bacterium]|nr:SDR family oxidoreductase [Eubacteriales bacterium]